MNSLLAQAPSISHDTGILVVAAIVAILCGGVLSIRRRWPLATVASGLLSLLLATFIVLARRYDQEFVMVSVPLLVFSFACFAGLGFWQISCRVRPEV